MDFLIRHWHCILPVIAIPAALFVLKNKDEVASEKRKTGPGEELENHEKQ